jgi:hypothetical protein
MARRFGYEVTELRSHFEQIRRFNLPVILELFHTTRSDTCYAALVRLDEDDAVVAFGPGDTLRVSREILERFWVHRAFVLWKDFEEFGGVDSKDGRGRAWVETGLKELGYLSDSINVTEDAFKAGVTQFQSSNYLSADGVVGPITAMALYSLSKQYSIPRLNEK